jgi:hypothetical protein
MGWRVIFSLFVKVLMSVCRGSEGANSGGFELEAAIAAWTHRGAIEVSVVMVSLATKVIAV